MGHAIHKILMVFPLGLLSAGVIFDIIYLISGKWQFVTVAYWLIAAGIIGGLAANWLTVSASMTGRI